MMTRSLLAIVTAVVVTSTGLAEAQTLGTFRWQQRPYCNVLTLTVTQKSNVYTLEGVDDQCGAGTRAAATGLAFPNPDGTIGFGLTVVTSPGATPLHLDATITLTALSGTWRDSGGATGAWTFLAGPAQAGSARPPARTAFPAGVSVGGSTISNVAPPVNATDAANRAYVDATAKAAAALTRNVSAYGVRVGSGSISNFGGGCVRFSPTDTTLVNLDVDLPIGAVVTSIVFKYFDNSSGQMGMALNTYVLAEGSAPTDALAAAHISLNGIAPGVRLENVPLVSQPPVSSTRGYYVYASATPHADGALAFCGAQVAYTLP